jgi:hypothetical protein
LSKYCSFFSPFFGILPALPPSRGGLICIKDAEHSLRAFVL